MARPLARMVDFIAAEPVRLSAFLRLPLIGLIVLLVSVWEVEHWLPWAYAAILGAYSVAALRAGLIALALLAVLAVIVLS